MITLLLFLNRLSITLSFSMMTAVPFLLQLAILASYSGNEVVAVYRYFRSLAADTPFTTARDNLIILFEKVFVIHLYSDPKLVLIMLSQSGLDVSNIQYNLFSSIRGNYCWFHDLSANL